MMGFKPADDKAKAYLIKEGMYAEEDVPEKNK